MSIPTAHSSIKWESWESLAELMTQPMLAWGFCEGCLERREAIKQIASSEHDDLSAAVVRGLRLAKLTEGDPHEFAVITIPNRPPPALWTLS